jgi:hypothetical protein
VIARRALSVTALCTLAILLLDALVVDEATPIGDDRIYELMAQDPGATHTFPFAYRVLVPSVVHVLPFGHTFSFSLLAWLATGACGGVTYVLLRRFDVGDRLAVALALVLATSPGLLIVSLRDGRNTDAATVLLMLVAVLFMVDRRPRALAVTLVVGAFIRESVIFLMPLTYAVWAVRWVDRDALKRTAAVCAPALVVYLALRVGIPTVGREQVNGYGDGLIEGRFNNLERGFDEGLTQLRRLFIAFGPLWLVVPLAVRDTPFVRRGLVLVACCLVAMTFALDWGRMILLAAPIVLVAAGVALQRRPRLVAPILAGCALLNVGYAVHMDRGGVRDGIDHNSPPPYPVQ